MDDQQHDPGRSRSDMPDVYVLHCHHDGHDCRHVYLSLPDLLMAASVGLRDHHLQSVSHVTFFGRIIMRESVLNEHVTNLIHAPYN